MRELIIFVTILSWHISAQATDLQQLNFEGFKVNGVYSKNKNDLNTLMQVYKNQINSDDELKASGLFSYVPTGVHKNFLSTSCDSHALSRLIEQHAGSNNSLDKKIEQWARFCGDQIYSAKKLPALIQAQMLEYDVKQNPYILNVEFTLRNGDIVTGVLALKDLETKRPLIISQCGLYCDAHSSSSVNDAIMHLFDESEYNLLALSSSSGEDFSKKNNYLGLGGFQEGEGLIQISRLLLSDNSFFKALVGEIHLHGISLGGNAALMGAVYASHNKDLPIKSAVAACPVVDLKPTMKSIFKRDTRGDYYRLVSLKHLKEVYEYMPNLHNYLKRDKKYRWSHSEIFDAFSLSAYEYTKSNLRNEAWPTAPFENASVSDLEDFWELNNFTNYIDEVNIPTTVLYSSDDMFVLDEFNANPLARKLFWNKNEYIGLINLRKGNHCAFSVGVGWDIFSTLIKSHFNKYSDFKPGIGENSPLLAQNYTSSSTLAQVSSKLWKNDKIMKTEWKIKPGDKEAKLYLTVFSPEKTKRRSQSRRLRFCRKKDPFNAPSWCYRKLKTKVSMQALMNTNIKMPLNKFSAQKVTRWLNVNTLLLDQMYLPIKGTANLPMFINFSGLYH